MLNGYVTETVRIAKHHLTALIILAAQDNDLAEAPQLTPRRASSSARWTVAVWERVEDVREVVAGAAGEVDYEAGARPGIQLGGNRLQPLGDRCVVAAAEELVPGGPSRERARMHPVESDAGQGCMN
jgi:hypothetical protein